MLTKRVLSASETHLRLWGETNLSPQQNRVWRHLVSSEECAISQLFVAARPDATLSKTTLRVQQQLVGMVTSKINQKLKGHFSSHVIRPGNSRFSYRLEPSA